MHNVNRVMNKLGEKLNYSDKNTRCFIFFRIFALK